MKVLIVVHDNHQESNVFPLGAAYIASSLLSCGVDVKVFCMDVYHYSNQELVDVLKSAKYDFVLLGFMAPRWRRTVRDLCSCIRSSISHDCMFVLGGYGPSAMPEYIIKETGADIVCIGESDEIIINIINAVKYGDSISSVKGIAYKSEDGSVVVNEKARKIKNLDDLPFPAWDLFPMEIYTSNLRFAGMKDCERAFPIISSRGCTDKCSFCFRLEKGIRSRSVDNVIAEMKMLHDMYNVSYFYFVDELAIISKKQILNLTDMIKKELPRIHYRMDCRVTCFDDDIARALKSSGCVFLNIGFESSSQLVLDQMNKRATVQMNVSAAETAIKYGIGVGLNFIWGMPGDNEKTLRENARFIMKYNQYDQVRTIRPVTPYPGSPLYNLAVSQGKLQGPDDFFNKFKNSDRYMINFMGIPEHEIYAMLLDVNKELIYDHFNNTTKDFDRADLMISELRNIYNNEDYLYTGPRQYNENSQLKPKYSGM